MRPHASISSPLYIWDPSLLLLIIIKYYNPSFNETNKYSCTVGKPFATMFYLVDLCLWIGDVTLTLSRSCNYLDNMATLPNFSMDRLDCASFVPQSLLEHQFKKEAKILHANYSCSSWRAYIILIVGQKLKTVNTINTSYIIILYIFCILFIIYS